jgi:putative heme-binding domain-containing protein
LLDLVTQTGEPSLQRAALIALQQFNNPEIGTTVLAQFTGYDESLRTAALNLLASRPHWSLQLLQAVDSGRIPASAVTPDAVQKIKTYPDQKIAELLRKHCSHDRVPTTAEMQKQIQKCAATVRSGAGDPYQGRKLFNMSCALCHKLFGQGAQIGPDLTPYKRDDLETMLLNIINPSAEIREGYESYLVSTRDGRTLSGFLADKDNQVLVLRGLDGVNQVLPHDAIKEMKSTGVSLMPQDLLTSLSEQQLRDLFAYLQSAQPLVGEAPQR